MIKDFELLFQKCCQMNAYAGRIHASNVLVMNTATLPEHQCFLVVFGEDRVEENCAVSYTCETFKIVTHPFLAKM